MKKILALTLSLAVILALCACGANPAGNADAPSTSPSTAPSATENKESNTATQPAETNKNEGVSYVGTWKVIPPDSNSFPPLYLVLNADGTAGYGAKLNNLAERIWYVDEDEDAKENQMELSREDNKGYGDDFYITEDGKLYLETNLRVGDNTYDHIYFEKQ